MEATSYCSEPIAKQNRLIILKGVIFALLIVLIFLLSKYAPQPLNILMEDMDDFQGFHSRRERIVMFLSSLGPYSSAIFVLLQALQVVASPIPGELTGLVGGYVFGKAFGFLLSTVGLAVGSWLAFELARILGRPLVERFVSKERLHRFDFLTTNKGATICFLLFLLPGFPKDYLSYALGLSPMRLTTFLMASIVGRMPGTYLLTLQGANMRNEEYLIAAAFSVISVSILFVGYLYRDRLFHWIKTKRPKHTDG
jgi:uncharacterized membrane protein YdjX (TVP38/TMEM64 family)